MRVYIYAYENTYGGLHGINEATVDEIDSVEVLNEYGVEMSESVISAYGLADEYEEDEFDWAEALAWEVYKIKDDVIFSIEMLDKLCSSLGHESFVEEYCERDFDVYEALKEG